MSSVSNEDHPAPDQDMASVQAVDSTGSLEAVDRTGFHRVCVCSSTDLICPIPLRIAHRHTCAPNISSADRLATKLFPQSRNIEWLTTSDCAHTFRYRKASAPWRTNCPACSVIADAIKVFWPDEKRKARSYGWSENQRLFNTQYPADDEHLQFFTKPGQ